MFIKIKLHPKSKKKHIEKIGQDKYEVWVKNKAEQNLANKEMLADITSFLKVDQKKVKIISGHHRPNKMLEIKT